MAFFTLKKCNYLAYWIFLIGFCFSSRAQGPGGVSTDLSLWLKADANVTPSTQGSDVTSWQDQSGFNNNAAYVTPMIGQTVLFPTYQLNSINFNPSINFAGTANNSFAALQGTFTPTITSNNVSAYAVFIMNSQTSGSGRIFIISQNATASDWQNQAGADFMSRSGSNLYGSRNSTNFNPVGPVVGQPAVLSSTHFTTTNLMKNEVNGADFTTKAYNTAAFNSSVYRFGMSTYSTNDWLNGNIAEVILYTSDQSSNGSNHIAIESYLAIKYGINKIGDYINSSGTTLWSATTNTPYNNDVFGIGQDDSSSLLQSQSNSMNTGSGDGTGQSGKGNIVISNPSALTNNSFLMIGHNTNDLSLSSNNLPAITGINSRLNRLWKVQQTGDVGTVSLSFDISGLNNALLNSSQLSLLIDTDGDGDFTTGTVNAIPQTSRTGNIVRYDALSLPNNAVFSFGILASAPGSVDGLTLWMKASDALPATGGTLTTWPEAFGSNSYTLTGTQTVVQNAVNFNPIVRFDRSGKLTGTTSIIMSEFATVNSWTGAINIERGTVVAPTTNNSAGSSRYAFRSANNGVFTGIIDASAPATNYMNFTPQPPSDEFNILLASGTGNVYRKNATAVGTGIFQSTAMSGIPQIGDRSSNDAKMNGDIAEVIIYSSSQAGAVRNRMESYLAIKYGIHKAENYVNSSDAIVWDATANSTYHNDVFGIAQDDNLALLQTQSNSMNTGSGDGTGQNGKGNIVISNPSTLTNNGFLMIGHNINDLSLSSNNPPAITGINSRLNRLWKVQQTGSVGTVSLSFDLSGLNNALLNSSQLRLLIDLDGDGDFTTGTVNAIPQTSRTGNIVRYDALSLPNNAVFSFGILATAPGSVDGLTLWMKASDALPATGGTLTNWPEAFGSNSYTLTGTQTVVQNAVNFNPIVRFDRSGKLTGTTSITMSEFAAVNS